MSSWITSAGAPSSWARAIDSCTKLVTAGLIVPSTTIRASAAGLAGVSARTGAARKSAISAAALLTYARPQGRAPA